MIYHGDCLNVLKGIPDNTFHVCVTSPPYWSLRDYGVPPTVWGGDPDCAHEWESAGMAEGYAGKRKWQHSANGRGEDQPEIKPTLRRDNPEGWNQIEQGKFCTKCAAWLGCLGLEPTPDLYVDHIVEVFEEVRRVLRKDGTLWLNLGDCYAAGRGGYSGSASTLEGSTRHQDEARQASNRVAQSSSFRRDRACTGSVRHIAAPGLKPKDLVGIPWMVAFALRAAGWYLRMDNIWAKTNPMPESIKDRPTKSHEYVFLLAKSEDYFYDADAVREPHKVASVARLGRARTGGKYRGNDGGQPRGNPHSLTTNLSNALSLGGRNRRSVWTLSTKPFPGAHFATFPPRLVEPCILAGSSEHGCCSVCGAPFRRIVKLGEPLSEQKASAGADANGEYHGKATKTYDGTGAQDPSAVKARILDGMRERVTTGWQPTCRHTLREIEPCIVVDPFHGSGTTGMVAEALGREYVGIELNKDYIGLRTPAPAEASA